MAAIKLGAGERARTQLSLFSHMCLRPGRAGPAPVPTSFTWSILEPIEGDPLQADQGKRTTVKGAGNGTMAVEWAAPK